MSSYYQNNKEKMKTYFTKYRENNRETIRENDKKNYLKNRQLITCECKSTILKTALKPHLLTLKHQRNMQLNS